MLNLVLWMTPDNQKLLTSGDLNTLERIITVLTGGRVREAEYLAEAGGEEREEEEQRGEHDDDVTA